MLLGCEYDNTIMHAKFFDDISRLAAINKTPLIGWWNSTHIAHLIHNTYCTQYDTHTHTPEPNVAAHIAMCASGKVGPIFTISHCWYVCLSTISELARTPHIVSVWRPFLLRRRDPTHVQNPYTSYCRIVPQVNNLERLVQCTALCCMQINPQ